MAYKYKNLTNDQVKNLRQEFGKNEIQDLGKKGPLHIFLRQIKNNSILYLLLASALISFVVGKHVTGGAILYVIGLIVVVGFIQEYRAEEAVNSLKSMLFPISNVVRNDVIVEIPSAEIVPGDILILGNGEKIPADCILLEQHELRVNESALTGESKEIVKHVLDNDLTASEDNMLYAGTYIVNGRCIARVKHIGMNTKFGAIANLISTTEKDLPLQDKVNKVAKYMVIVAITGSLVMGAIILFRAETIDKDLLINTLILMVALSVSAFPEGFPVVLTTTLALGAKRMSKKNAIVNRMSIIETLGETSVICSDKTGTITKGEMTAKYIFTGQHLYEIEGTGYVADGHITENNTAIDLSKHKHVETLLKASVLCNDARIERVGVDAEYAPKGTPTEAALLILAAKAGIFVEDMQGERLEETPFNSERKMMSILHSSQNEINVYAKGAPEILINKCNRYLSDAGPVNFDQEVKNRFTTFQNEMSQSAFRTLAIAYKPLDTVNKSYGETDFILLGIISMEDPPRPEVAQAIQVAKRAGVRVVMISGDNKETVTSIGKQIGLVGRLIEGVELDDMTDSELEVAVGEAALFARVRPDHKLRIVKALKSKGEIVAMTGDGVNDAPALKEAHVGIAMGNNGTDVSRSVADLTLKDDNFATIVVAIAEGRTIFNNIRKFITYQLSCNFSEVLILLIGVLLAPTFGWDMPILASIQILFMNLVTDNLPSLTLGFNPAANDIMNEAPRKNNQLINRSLFGLLLFTAFVMMTLTLISYHIYFVVLGFSADQSHTSALVTLILLEIATAFSFRSFRKGTLNRSPLVNKYLVVASVISIITTLLVVYTPLNKIFETVPISISNWGIALCAALVSLVIFDVAKVLNNKRLSYILDTK